MPRILELKRVDDRLGVILDMDDLAGMDPGCVSLWTSAEADKQAKDSEEIGREEGRIAGLKEAAEIAAHVQSKLKSAGYRSRANGAFAVKCMLDERVSELSPRPTQDK